MRALLRRDDASRDSFNDQLGSAGPEMPLLSTPEREARFLPTGIPPLAPELQHDA
jgi:hypothetical protein